MQRKSLWTAVALLVLLLLSTAAAIAAGRKYETDLRGGNEVPVRMTNAEGEAKLKLNKDGTSLHFKLKVEDIRNAWMAHLHLASAGVNGPIVVWLFPRQAPPPANALPGLTKGTLAEGDITASDLTGPLAGQPFSALIDAVNAGNIYVNVHTNDFVDPPNTGPGDFPGGEIRGQLMHDHDD